MDPELPHEFLGPSLPKVCLPPFPVMHTALLLQTLELCFWHLQWNEPWLTYFL